MIHSQVVLSSKLRLHTDASSVGMGDVYKSHFFFCSWPLPIKDMHINVLECFAVAAAILIWGVMWGDIEVVIFTDNQPITFGSHLVSRLLEKQEYNVYGYNNLHADALSCLQVDKFRQEGGKVDRCPTVLSSLTWGCKIHQKALRCGLAEV